jgi:hypothetical protein
MGRQPGLLGGVAPGGGQRTAVRELRVAYGELAALGIVGGQPFAPDDRMRSIRRQAAIIGNAQMRVQSFADRRPDRIVWPDRYWEWAALRFENGDFDRADSVDTEAPREVVLPSHRSQPGHVPPGHPRRIVVLARPPGRRPPLSRWQPQLPADGPFPGTGKLFWSVTVYDAGRAARSRPIRGGPSSAPFSTLPTRQTTSPWTCTSGPTRPPTTTSGSRSDRIRGGSCTSASTDPSPPPSPVRGNCRTSSEPDAPEPTHDMSESSVGS